jgi:hypothetical protein
LPPNEISGTGSAIGEPPIITGVLKTAGELGQQPVVQSLRSGQLSQLEADKEPSRSFLGKTRK